MNYIKIKTEKVGVTDEVYRKIKSIERSERRQSEKLKKTEVLIDSEAELDSLKSRLDNSPFETLERQEQFAVVMKIISNDLTPNERLAVKAAYLYGKPQSEIAEEMGLTLRQVKYLCGKAVKKIRRIYDSMM